MYWSRFKYKRKFKEEKPRQIEGEIIIVGCAWEQVIVMRDIIFLLPSKFIFGLELDNRENH